MQRFDSFFANPERTWAPPFPDPEATQALRTIIRRERPEIVHGHDWLARSFLPLKAESKAKFVMSLHYYTLSCHKKSLMFKNLPCSGPAFKKCLGCSIQHYHPGKGIPIALVNWVMRKSERAAVDIFLPVSQATADGNELGPGDSYEIIPNFMPEEGEPSVDVQTYLVQLPDQPFLLFVGDLRHNKGIQVLLSAYARMESAPPLVLIGKVWPETPKVFPPNVFVLKNWPNEAVLAAWSRSLIGIVPSLWPEPFGIVVIEAMASGRPVVASRIGGIPDIVGEDEAGLLVPPGNIEALLQAIQRLVINPTMREEMGHSARLRAAAFKATAIVPRIEGVYQNLLEGTIGKHERSATGQHRCQ
jgi:glycosyltransferase involved in cell wall biosynthesis